MERVAVVGGGLAGLVAARRLAERDIDVDLYERTDRLGGRVGSEYRDGFVLDRGFQVLFPSYPAATRELDLGALSLQSFAPGAVIARPGERSILADPLRDPRALSASLFNREVTLGDKLRTLRLRRELTRLSVDEILADDDRTIDAALSADGFSTKFRHAFAAPFLGGITLDRSLSSAAYVFRYAFKMLGEANAAIPSGGMQAIPDQLAAQARNAGVRVHLETPVDSLDAGDDVELVTPRETVAADGAVVATDPAMAESLTGVGVPTETRGCVTQHFSLPTTQHLDLGGRLLLNAEDARPNHVALLSAVADDYSPDDRRLLSATFLGVPDDIDDALAADVHEALASWYPEYSFANLELLSTHRISNAQLVQPPGFRSSVPQADDPTGPVVLAGNYTRWSSIQGALESGRQAATALIG